MPNESIVGRGPICFAPGLSLIEQCSSDSQVATGIILRLKAEKG